MNIRWLLFSLLTYLNQIEAFSVSSSGDAQLNYANNRKSFLSTIKLVTIGAFFTYVGPVDAFDAITSAELIRKGASNIPGYGQPDCFYPRDFLGLWNIRREIVDITTPLSEDKVDYPEGLKDAAILKNKVITYVSRWIQHDNNVIADRAFNEKNLQESMYPGSTRDIQWNPSNPNVLSLNLIDGTFKEIRITKRSFETPSIDQYGTSEFARLTIARSEAVPQLLAFRTLTKYKIGSNGSIDGLELVKYYPTVSFSTESDPYLVIKSRLLLMRKND